MRRLLGMSKLLKHWNQQRIEQYSNSAVAGVSLQEVNILKELISAEVTKLKLSNAEVVSDQLLFLMVGAIKSHVQNKSDKPWELVNLSVKELVTRQRALASPLHILVFSTLIIASWMLTSMGSIHKKETAYVSPFSDALVNETENTTLSNLQVIYKRMQIGDCQLPQAAMLQSTEQAAFVTFVNSGKVDLDNADDLKHALGHVNCLYSLKMMPKP